MNFTRLSLNYKFLGGIAFFALPLILIRDYVASHHAIRLEQRIVLEPPEPVYPGEAWEEMSPESLGLNPSKLRKFKRKVGPGSFGCVARNGYIADRWGIQLLKILGPARMRGWASATKPYIASLLLFAKQEGRIQDLDSKIEQWDWSLQKEDQEITLAHLANMTSGYGLPEKPGEAFAYNNYGVSLLYQTVIERIYETSVDDLDSVQELFRDPGRLGALNFESENLFIARHGLPRLAISTCDMVRFGLLLTREGQWEDQQIISQELLVRYLQPQVDISLPRTLGASGEDYLEVGTSGGDWDDTPLGPGVYGFFFWHNTEGQLWPDVPHDPEFLTTMSTTSL